MIPGTLNSTTGDLEIDFEFGFRPNITLTASFIGSDTLSATLYFDIPRLDLAITQVLDVTSTCDPAAQV